MSISAPCHPERSEGSLTDIEQGSLAALGMTMCVHGNARACTDSGLPYLFPYLKALPRGNHPSSRDGGDVAIGAQKGRAQAVLGEPIRADAGQEHGIRSPGRQ